MNPAGQFDALLPSEVDAKKLTATLRARLSSQTRAGPN
jgi:hypothetical protein